MDVVYGDGPWDPSVTDVGDGPWEPRRLGDLWTGGGATLGDPAEPDPCGDPWDRGTVGPCSPWDLRCVCVG